MVSQKSGILGLVLLIGTGCAGCTRDDEPIPASVIEAPPPSPIAPTTSPNAVRGDWIERIDLPGGHVGFVTPPVGATDRRPIVVAIHGAVDDPGLICGAWRIITDVYPFVVCPAGTPAGGGRYSWSSTDQVTKRVRDAIDAVETKYPDHVVVGAPVLYVAFSQGATMAGPALAAEGKRVPRAVLSEGAYRTFEDAALARRFHAAGGERVLYTCSQPGCSGAFAGSRAGLDRAGVAARVLDCGNHGHAMPPPVREAIHDGLPWVIEGMPGWAGYAAAPKLERH